MLGMETGTSEDIYTNKKILEGERRRKKDTRGEKKGKRSQKKKEKGGLQSASKEDVSGEMVKSFNEKGKRKKNQ